MSLTTLTAVKTQLGIADASQDAALAPLIRSACAMVRAYCRRSLGGLISAVAAGNPAVVTAIAHGLQSGDVVLVGDTGVIDGPQTVTKTSDDQFSVAMNVATPATGGWYVWQRTEYYCGGGDQRIVLRETPVVAVTAVYLDPTAAFGAAAGAFAASTLLTAGVDYAVDARSGLLHRLNAVWPCLRQQAPGLLAVELLPALGNVKVIYTAGFAGGPPADLQQAATTLACDLYRWADKGGPLRSESLDYYSYTRATPDEQARILGSVVNSLQSYRKWVL